MKTEMEKAKFTKGPWKAYANLLGNSFHICCAGKRGDIDEHSPIVADTWGAEYSPNKDPDNGRNDAHLIAAAPDMYAMLSELLHNLERGNSDHTDINDVMIPRIENLLATVRGE